MSINPITFIRALRPRKSEHYLLLSFFMMGLSKYFPQGSPGAYIFMFLAVVFFFGVFILTKWSIHIEGQAGKWYWLLAIWSIGLTIQFAFTGTQGLGTNFSTIFASKNFLPNLIPLTVLCLKRDDFDLKYLINLLLLMSLVYFLIFPFAIQKVMAAGAIIQASGLAAAGEEYLEMIHESTMGITYFFPGFLVLFFRKYIKNVYFYVFLAIIFEYLFLNTYMARRGNVLICSLYLLLFWFTYSTRENRIDFKTVMLGIIVFAGISYFVISNENSIFSIFFERLDTDSRSGLADDFINDFNTMDWIIGRGWFGKYAGSFANGLRDVIEVGYLYLILKGGIIYLIPYVFVLLSSAMKGYFDSNNFLCKGFAILCFMKVFSLIPFGVPSFTIEEFLVWVGVVFCNSAYYRNLSNNEIKLLIT